MIDFFIKKGDRAPALIVTCIDENGVVVDLTAGVSVKFSMINPGTPGDPKVNGAAATFEGLPTTGQLKYLWGATDTDTPGDYNGEFEVTWSDGTKTTFPNFRYIKIRIGLDIA